MRVGSTVRVLLAGGCGLLAACAVFALDVEKGGKAPVPDGPAFRVEQRDGKIFEGKLVEPIWLKTDYGGMEIEAKQVRRITFRPPGEGKTQDLVELIDKTILRGRLEVDSLTLVVNQEKSKHTTEELRELKAVSEQMTGWLAIAIGLLTLTLMEIVLGIDNVIFLAIIAGKLPPEQQPRARKLGLAAALGTRILLLASLSFLLGMTKPLFTLPEIPLLHDIEAREISLRDLVLLLGGLFLIGKSVIEMHEKLEAEDAKPDAKPVSAASFGKVLIQIAIIDIVFSLDSVITAVGMVDVLWVMIVAMVIAMLVMLAFAGFISNFVERHPTIKVLALAFLILIGVMLTAEGLGQHMDKGYIYFAMAFAVGVEMINLRVGRSHAKPRAAATSGASTPNVLQ